MEGLGNRDEVAHIIGGIGKLLVAELSSIAPIGALGGFVEFDAKKVLDYGFEAMARRVGAHEFAGDFGAEDRLGLDGEVVFEGGEVETGKVKDFADVGSFEQLFEVRGLGLLALDPKGRNESAGVAELNQAKAIA